MTEKQVQALRPAAGRMKKLEVSKYAEYAVRAAMALTLSAVRIFSAFSPFGAAFAAAAPIGMPGIVTALGAIGGYLIGGDFMWALKYLASVVLIRTMKYILRGTELYEKELFSSGICFVSLACTGFVYAADSGWAVRDTALYVTEIFLAGGCTFFYEAALAPWSASDDGSRGKTCHGVSTVLLMATLMMGISVPQIFGVLSPGRAAAVVLTMFISFKGGIGLGCACGAALGAAMDMTAGTVPFFAFAYTFSALVSGLFSGNGKLVFTLAYILADAIAVVWTWSTFSMLPALYETFAAAVIFMVLPGSVFAKASVFFPSGVSGYGFLRAREYTKNRVQMTGDAFRSLYGIVRDASGDGENTENSAVIFDKAADAVCRSCKSAARCWQKDYVNTLDVMNNITPKLMHGGSVEPDDFPQSFSESCENLKELVSAINSETRSMLMRRQYRRRLTENRSAAYSQYADIASVLSAVANELGTGTVVETALERRLTKYLRGLDIDASVAVFRVGGGRLRAEIKSSSLYILRRNKAYLNELSSVMGTRLCTPESYGDPGKMILLEAEPLTVSVGVAAVKKSGERVSGDRGAYFRTDEGMFCSLISDGMGCGEDAAKISGATVSALEQFIKAGMAPELAVRILSDLMFLKNADTTDSATVDMLCLDMFSGEAKIFKYGAPPSYVKSGTSVKRIGSAGFPAGLLRPGKDGNSAIKVKLPAGSFAIFCSDGILAGEDDKWLRELVSGYDGDDPRLLARSVLEKALGKFGAEDDMTVMAVRTAQRE